MPTNPSTLRMLVVNPFYAGYHAKITKPVRGAGYRTMSVSDFELSDGEAGTWPCPISLTDWQRIRARFSQARKPSHATCLLTGVLRCPAGERMRSMGAVTRPYQCYCEGKKHHAGGRRWEAFARRLALAWIESVPDSVLSAPVRTRTEEDRAETERQLRLALRAAQERQREHDALLRDVIDPTSYLRRFDRVEVERMIDQTKAELAAARALVDRLTAEQQEPDAGETLAHVALIREGGAAVFWDAMPEPSQRAFLRGIVRAIHLDPSPGPYRPITSARVEWQPWVVRENLTIPVPRAWFDARD